MGGRRKSSPTIIDVARAAGVSRATASRALGRYGSVSAEAEAAVRAAAVEVGYEVNHVARSMITGRTRTIGVVLSDIENDFFVRALRGISHVTREHGYDVFLASTDEDVALERKAVKALRGRRVEGLLVCPVDPTDAAHLKSAANAGEPLVLLDRGIADLTTDCVAIDNRRAGYEATRALLDAGHTRIAVVSGIGQDSMARALRNAPDTEQPDETPSEGRVVGHYKALLEAGVDPDPRMQVPTEFSRAEVTEAVSRVLASSPRPTAFLTSDSLETLGALHAIRLAGLSIPSDISLLGFDDAAWIPVVLPPITVVEQPAYEMGAHAARALIERIEGGDGPAGTKILPTRIITRSSVGPPPDARPPAPSRQARAKSSSSRSMSSSSK